MSLSELVSWSFPSAGPVVKIYLSLGGWGWGGVGWSWHLASTGNLGNTWAMEGGWGGWWVGGGWVGGWVVVYAPPPPSTPSTPRCGVVVVG